MSGRRCSHVADLAGGDWPERARVSAVSLVTASADQGSTLGITLLRDLRTVFGQADRLPTEAILDRLHELVESPWGDLRGKPLDARGLARRLGKYGVKPTVYREGEATRRGYLSAELIDPWSRYLTDTTPKGEENSSSSIDIRGEGVALPAPQESVTSETAQHEPRCGLCGDSLTPFTDAGNGLCGTCDVFGREAVVS